ncbi:uncharacterized protein [Branchiostoma lanceolatum]|uniref:uncharacterized protein n=1 Tax=Branchiostoma lanceolatum TaxID=7740 RepID=UPI0034572E6F
MATVTMATETMATLPVCRRPSTTMDRCLLMTVVAVTLLGHANGQRFELCNLGQYNVSRYDGFVIASTTVFAPLFVNGTQQADSKIFNYFKGANDRNLKMRLPGTIVTQTYIGSAPAREVAVGAFIPFELWSNPPVPTDEEVVIDTVPSTIMYEVAIQGQKRGVTPDTEAAKLFSILKEHDEPVWSEDDYYYYLRPLGSGLSDLRDGWESFGGAILIFATNEKVNSYYKSAEGEVKSQLRLPKCLRDREISWPTSAASVNVAVERKSCRQNFCNEHHCATYKLMDTFESGTEKRRYRVLPSVYNWAPTCQLEHSSAISQPVLYEYLRAMGAWPYEGFQMFDQNMMTVYQNETGPNHCQKKFRSFAVVPVETPYETARGAIYKPPQQYPNRARRVNYWRPTYYVKCFGGNGDGDAIFDVAGKLASELDDIGVCRRTDHFHVSQYNRQSRLLDRHNEIWFWDDKCRSLINNAPNITFDYAPVKVDSYFPIPFTFYREERPIPEIGDRCVQYDCQQFQKVTTFDGFIEKFSPPKSWRLETAESHVHKGDEKPPCYFPFVVDGQLFHNCTYHNSHRPWCAWDAVFAPGYWSYCDEDGVGVKRFDGVITMKNMTYSRDLEDSSTVAYKDLASRVEVELTKTFATSLEDFVKLTVTAFLDDTINVGFHLKTTGQSTTNASHVVMTMKEIVMAEDTATGGIVFDHSSLQLKDATTCASM